MTLIRLICADFILKNFLLLLAQPLALNKRWEQLIFFTPLPVRQAGFRVRAYEENQLRFFEKKRINNKME